MQKWQKLSRSTCEDEAEAQSLRAQWLAGASIRADARLAAVGKAALHGLQEEHIQQPVGCAAVGEQAVASNAMKGCMEAV